MDDATREAFRQASWRIWEAHFHLHNWMIDAIRRGHLASVQYLLELGYVDARFIMQKDFTADEDEMVVAYQFDRDAIAKALHRRGFALDVSADWHEDPQEFATWLGSLPNNYSVACVNYQHLNHVDPDLQRWADGTAHVIVSWPPKRNVPLQITLADDHKQHWIDKYIAAIGHARRVEARHWLEKNLGFWRAWTRIRTIALYWQETTQRRLAAPGGKGRQADLKAFEEEFVSS